MARANGAPKRATSLSTGERRLGYGWPLAMLPFLPVPMDVAQQAYVQARAEERIRTGNDVTAEETELNPQLRYDFIWKGGQNHVVAIYQPRFVYTHTFSRPSIDPTVVNPATLNTTDPNNTPLSYLHNGGVGIEMVRPRYRDLALPVRRVRPDHDDVASRPGAVGRRRAAARPESDHPVDDLRALHAAVLADAVLRAHQAESARRTHAGLRLQRVRRRRQRVTRSHRAHVGARREPRARCRRDPRRPLHDDHRRRSNHHGLRGRPHAAPSSCARRPRSRGATGIRATCRPSSSAARASAATRSAGSRSTRSPRRACSTTRIRSSGSTRARRRRADHRATAITCRSVSIAKATPWIDLFSGELEQRAVGVGAVNYTIGKIDVPRPGLDGARVQHAALGREVPDHPDGRWRSLCARADVLGRRRPSLRLPGLLERDPLELDHANDRLRGPHVGPSPRALLARRGLRFRTEHGSTEFCGWLTVDVRLRSRAAAVSHAKARRRPMRWAGPRSSQRAPEKFRASVFPCEKRIAITSTPRRASCGPSPS